MNVILINQDGNSNSNILSLNSILKNVNPENFVVENKPNSNGN